MAGLLHALQDPHLVARFQRFCGLFPPPQRAENVPNGDGELCNNWRAPLKRDCQNGGRTLAGAHSHIPNGNAHHANGGTANGTHKQDYAAKYIVKNYLLYYLFRFAAALGQEIFYITFLPFVYWNMDPYIARRLIHMWAIVMYIGQASKDILKWPRPTSPPVVKLETRVDAEYGMPSTHAMAATSISFTFLLSSMHRYKYPFEVGLIVAIFISSLVSLSRLYTGMHNVLDVIVGALVAAGFVAVTHPLWDITDQLLLMNPYCLVLVITVPFLMCYKYPKLDHYSPTRADTTVILGVFTGSSIGFWITHHLGNVYEPFGSLPLNILSSPTAMLMIFTARFILGLCIIVLTRQVVKSLSLHLLCFWYTLPITDAESRKKLEIEVPYKFATYSSIGLVAISVVPLAYQVFQL